VIVSGTSPAEYVARLKAFQARVRAPVRDITKEAPEVALASLQNAVTQAPKGYHEYLAEALACYEGGELRAAVLMVWAATMQHLYLTASKHPGGVKALEAANKKRYGNAKGYRPVRRGDDFLYLREAQFIQLGEDAGMFNRTARRLLEERLTLRNNCGHPTGYRPGRGEVVVFVESLLRNIVSGQLLNW